MHATASEGCTAHSYRQIFMNVACVCVSWPRPKVTSTDVLTCNEAEINLLLGFFSHTHTFTNLQPAINVEFFLIYLQFFYNLYTSASFDSCGRVRVFVASNLQHTFCCTQLVRQLFNENLRYQQLATYKSMAFVAPFVNQRFTMIFFTSGALPHL